MSYVFHKIVIDISYILKTAHPFFINLNQTYFIFFHKKSNPGFPQPVLESLTRLNMVGLRICILFLFSWNVLVRNVKYFLGFRKPRFCRRHLPSELGFSRVQDAECGAVASQRL